MHDHIPVGDLRLNTTVLDLAIDEYEKFRSHPDYAEEYKWNVIGELHGWFEEHGVDAETVHDFVEKIMEENPSGGTLINRFDIFPLSDSGKEDPQLVADQISNLLDESEPLEDRVRVFREGIDMGTGGVTFLLSVAHPDRYGPFRAKNVERFIRYFTDAEDFSLGSYSVPEKVALYRELLEVLRDYLDGKGLVKEDDQTVLPAQDLIYTVTADAYPEPRFNFILRALSSQASELESYRDQEDRLIKDLQQLPPEFLQEQLDYYHEDREKVNQIRHQVIRAVVEDREIDLDQVKAEVQADHDKDILRNWTDFPIVAQLVVNYIQRWTDTYLEDLAEFFADQIGSEDLATHIVSFQGAQNYPSSSPWFALYPAYREDHRDAVQLFIRLYPEETVFGLHAGQNVGLSLRDDQKQVVRDRPVTIGEVLEAFRQKADRFYDLNESLGGDSEPPPDRPIYRTMARQLERRKQIVLHGPPGTGKTYLAHRFARWWLQRDEDSAPDMDRVTTITFHPAFAYEDFIEGLTARTGDDGTLTYSIEDGVFKEIAEEARDAYEQAESKTDVPRYVLIIDEINRGNLPKIFGETITLLEEDKRLGADNEISANLSHSGRPFSVPPNMYVIGTMNTADRSIALLDAAIRRRFRFLHLGPDLEVLRDHFGFEGTPDVEEAIEHEGSDRELQALSIRALQRINEVIRSSPDLGKGKQVGHTYLMGGTSEDAIRDAWRFEILPLLEEYYFGDLDRLASDVFQGGGDDLFDWERQEIRDFDVDDLRSTLRQLVTPEAS